MRQVAQRGGVREEQKQREYQRDRALEEKGGGQAVYVEQALRNGDDSRTNEAGHEGIGGQKQ